MIKDSLMEIGGVGLYGVVSVLLFFTVFTLALAWALRLRRAFLDAMGALPLADGSRDARKEGSHE
ncbi:MAG: CcoQ/FixQ family Cbb3-type cytochrome c oxidase assembly chaperone [Verrucomicrobiota bacterium]